MATSLAASQERYTPDKLLQPLHLHSQSPQSMCTLPWPSSTGCMSWPTASPNGEPSSKPSTTHTTLPSSSHSVARHPWQAHTNGAGAAAKGGSLSPPPLQMHASNTPLSQTLPAHSSARCLSTRDTNSSRLHHSRTQQTKRTSPPCTSSAAHSSSAGLTSGSLWRATPSPWAPSHTMGIPWNVPRSALRTEQTLLEMQSLAQQFVGNAASAVGMPYIQAPTSCSSSTGEVVDIHLFVNVRGKACFEKSKPAILPG